MPCAKSVVRTLIVTLFIGLLLSMPAWSAAVRHVIADQNGWNEKLGFYVELGNDTAKDDTVAQYKTMSVLVGVANGTTWRQLSAKRRWEPNKEYTLKFVVLADKADVYIDGKRAAGDKGVFSVFDGKPIVNGVPGSCTGLTAYGIFVKSIKITTSDGNDFEAIYDKADYDPKLRPTTPTDWQLSEDDKTFTVECIFEIIPEV